MKVVADQYGLFAVRALDVTLDERLQLKMIIIVNCYRGNNLSYHANSEGSEP